jgi:hypothetical protein
MRELWLVMTSSDAGKTWVPATNEADFREEDAKKKAERFAKSARGLYPYRAFKFIAAVSK